MTRSHRTKLIDTRLRATFLPFCLEAFLYLSFAVSVTPETPIDYVGVLSLCSRDSHLNRARAASLSFIRNFRVPLAIMPNQKPTWTYVPSNAGDEGEVFDLSQTPNRPQSAIYSHGTHDSMTANAVIRLLDADRNQGIIDDGQEVMVNGLRRTVVLWDHQKAGVVWMRQREQGGKGGGIVADEMGQGVLFLLAVLSY